MIVKAFSCEKGYWSAASIIQGAMTRLLWNPAILLVPFLAHLGHGSPSEAHPRHNNNPEPAIIQKAPLLSDGIDS